MPSRWRRRLMKKDEIVALMPALFQRAASEGSPLDTLLGVMEQMHAGAEQGLETLAANLDPRRSPEPWLNMLASWFGLDRSLTETRKGEAIPRGLAGVRELLPLWMPLQRARGTSTALLATLRAATGETGFAIDHTESARSLFHLVVL